MGMGWKNVSGGEYSKRKCKCGKGFVVTYVSDHEESEYPPFDRDARYHDVLKCENKCEEINEREYEK